MDMKDKLICSGVSPHVVINQIFKSVLTRVGGYIEAGSKIEAIVPYIIHSDELLSTAEEHNSFKNGLEIKPDFPTEVDGEKLTVSKLNDVYKKIVITNYISDNDDKHYYYNFVVWYRYIQKENERKENE